MQKIMYTNEVDKAIDALIADMHPTGLFVLVDSNTYNCALPILQNGSEAVARAKIISVQSGDENKNAESLQSIWQQLSQGGATRNSVLINLGGGMITDLGGFAAATFKRGIRFINVPTTLLGAVDAAVGGKTGINFNSLKNEIGAFAEAQAVIISTLFFPTLDAQQVLSGYAEMLKHGLLDDAATFSSLLAYDITDADYSSDALLTLLQKSVGVKQKVVAADPKEQGLRKALNLGHTIGHAFESFAMQRNSPIPHGYAVAWGLVVELVLSHMKLGFPSEILHKFASYVKEHYGYFYITCDDYPVLLQLMSHDKKNDTPDAINFTLLTNVGEVHINCVAKPDEVKSALDIYRDLLE